VQKAQPEPLNDTRKWFWRDSQTHNPHPRIISQQHGGFAAIVRAEHLDDGGDVEAEEGAEEEETEAFEGGEEIGGKCVGEEGGIA